jgi:cytochrome c-type biogenesis protein CcmH
MRGRLQAFAAALAAALCMAAASDPADRLPDPAQEAKARAIFQEIRCVVCQNESIDDSEAPLARDLRQIVREQVHAGRSDAEIKAFLVARYGQFVLLRPSFSLGNAPLWLTPPILVIGAGVWLLLRALRRRSTPEAPLSAEEEKRLAALAGSDSASRFRPKDVARKARSHD